MKYDLKQFFCCNGTVVAVAGENASGQGACQKLVVPFFAHTELLFAHNKVLSSKWALPRTRCVFSSMECASSPHVPVHDFRARLLASSLPYGFYLVVFLLFGVFGSVSFQVALGTLLDVRRNNSSHLVVFLFFQRSVRAARRLVQPQFGIDGPVSVVFLLFAGLFVIFFCVVVPVVLACLPARHFRHAVLIPVLFVGCAALGPTNIWHQWTSLFAGLLCVALLVSCAAVVVPVVMAC